MRKAFYFLFPFLFVFALISKSYADRVEYVKIYVEITNQYAGHIWSVSLDNNNPLKLTLNGLSNGVNRSQTVSFFGYVNATGNWEKLPLTIDDDKNTIQVTANNPTVLMSVTGLIYKTNDISVTGFAEWIGYTAAKPQKEFSGTLTIPTLTIPPSGSISYEINYNGKKGIAKVERWGRDVVITFSFPEANFLQ